MKTGLKHFIQNKISYFSSLIKCKLEENIPLIKIYFIRAESMTIIVYMLYRFLSSSQGLARE